MLRRIANFLRSGRADRELDEEVHACVDLLTEERIREGVEPADARRQALIELGGIEQVKEEVRAVRGLPFVESLIRDLRFGLRSLRRTPGLSLAAVSTLGLALGANATVYALLDRMVLRPLPVRAASELVAVRGAPFLMLPTPPGTVRGTIETDCTTYPLYLALRARVPVFAEMLVQVRIEKATVTGGTVPVPVRGAAVSGSFFPLLGIRAAAGRLLTPDDDGMAPGDPPVVLAHGLWKRHFGGDPSVLNRTIRLNGMPMTVVGVAASGFTGTMVGEEQDVFIPLRLGSAFFNAPFVSALYSNMGAFPFDSPSFVVYRVMARLKPGIGLAEAERVANAAYQRLLDEALAPDANTTPGDREFFRKQRSKMRLTLAPAGYASSEQSSLSRDLRTPLLLLLALCVLALIVAASNVANLFFARGAARWRDTAIRFAIGASRWRILQERLVESLLVASAAGILGLLLANWTSRLTPVLLAIERLPDGVTTVPDSRVCGLIAVLSLAAGIFIWAASSLQTVRHQPIASASTRHVRAALTWRRALVTLQITLSIILLCASGVLSRSLVHLVSFSPGFVPQDLYALSLDASQAGYDATRAATFYRQAVEQLEALPGVRRVTFASYAPLAGGKRRSRVFGDLGDDAAGAEVGNAGPGHFANLGAALAAGREFSEEDGLSGVEVAVINESLARELYGESSALGRLVGFSESGALDMRVVGVLEDVQYNPRIPVSPAIFMPYSETSATARARAFALRTERGVKITREMVLAAVRRIDASVAVDGFGPVTEQIARTFYRDRMLALFSLAFAALATVLCGIGIFGLASFAVSRRVPEIAIRITLGATRGSIRWMVMKETAVLTVVGCAAGLALFAVSSRILSQVAFEATPGDPASAAAAAAVLSATTLAAALLPANRAARLALADALRQD